MITTLDAQKFYESGPDDHGGMGGGIECSQPCLVVQQLVGVGYDNSGVECAMRLVPGVESYVKWVVSVYYIGFLYVGKDPLQLHFGFIYGAVMF